MSKLAAAGLSRTVAGPAAVLPPAPAVAGREASAASASRAIESASSTASARLLACSTRAIPLLRNSSASDDPDSPINTAASARSAATGPKPDRSTPLSRPPAISTSGRGNVRRAAMTASGCVPCESLMKRTPLTVATCSRRCSTPANAAAAGRIFPAGRPNKSATATAARALETLWSPGMASSEIGMMRRLPASCAAPPPATGSRPTPAATIQPSSTPSPPGSGRPRRYVTTGALCNSAYALTTGSSALRTSAPAGSTSSARRRFTALYAARDPWRSR